MLALITSGEYSDYRIEACIEIPSRNWLVEKAQEYKNLPGEEYVNKPRIMDFVPWILEMYPDEAKLSSYEEIHLGSYNYVWDI